MSVGRVLGLGIVRTGDGFRGEPEEREEEVLHVLRCRVNARGSCLEDCTVPHREGPFEYTQGWVEEPREYVRCCCTLSGVATHSE